MIDTYMAQSKSRSVLYALIDKEGKATGLDFNSASAAAAYARARWPDQEQDETRSGKGWDIEAVR